MSHKRLLGGEPFEAITCTIVGGILGAIIVAALGAVILLLVVGLIRKLVS
jgi:uncharacterized membrane protein YeaQ/YmgE (transglycosylase-associated protein family)